MATQFKKFCECVVKALVIRGWGPNGAKAEVTQTEPGYMEALLAAALTVDQAAAQIIRDHYARQTASSANREA